MWPGPDFRAITEFLNVAVGSNYVIKNNRCPGATGILTLDPYHDQVTLIVRVNRTASQRREAQKRRE